MSQGEVPHRISGTGESLLHRVFACLLYPGAGVLESSP